MQAILAAVDLSTIVSFVVASGILVIGINLAFKGVGLSKRAIKSA